ncbi:MAG: PrsW family intramembrane metalloprotease [Bacillota bacterium]|nr:PrsW family intramembrane metalloprotease [Bacillota bacterium]
MFFFMPMAFSRIIFIYILAAVIPAFILLRYVYRQDRIEKEPPALLMSLVWYGVIAALCAIVLERIGNLILDNTITRSSPYYILVLAFLVVGAAEEGCKFFFLKRRTWNDWNFSHMFDGVVYSVFVSLGFAAFENIKYVFSYGLSVVLPRALFAIPGHLGFSVFMGVFYGRARLCENRGDKAGRNINLVSGYVSAVLLHGFYDACAMSGTAAASIVFYAFVAVMYVVVYRMIRKASREDRPVY